MCCQPLSYTNACSINTNNQIKTGVDDQILKDLPCRFFEGEPEKKKKN